MRIIVRVSVSGSERPAAGLPVRVEVRDTTFEDAPAPTIASATGRVRDDSRGILERLELDVEALPDSAIVWVHIDVDGDGRLSIGDFVTTVSYPVPHVEQAEMDVAVKRI